MDSNLCLSECLYPTRRYSQLGVASAMAASCIAYGGCDFALVRQGPVVLVFPHFVVTSSYPDLLFLRTPATIFTTWASRAA